MSKSTKPAPPPPEPTTTVIETFRSPRYDITPLTTPSCYNGYVFVHKDLITIERVDEPAEVVHARIQKLWDESDNHHDFEPLASAAKRLGYALIGSRGRNAKPRR